MDERNVRAALFMRGWKERFTHVDRPDERCWFMVEPCSPASRSSTVLIRHFDPYGAGTYAFRYVDPTNGYMHRYKTTDDPQELFLWIAQHRVIPQDEETT